MKKTALSALLRALLFLPALSVPSTGPLHAAAKNGGLTLQVVWNNPFDPSRGEETRFVYSASSDDHPVRILLFSADGRRVRVLAERTVQAGVSYTAAWDGRNEEGRFVDSGVYFVAIDDGRRRAVRRVAVKRE